MKNKKKLFAIAVAVLLQLAAGCSSDTLDESDLIYPKPLADVAGVTHVSGKYSMDAGKDFLNEGADQLLQLGTRVIKVFMTAQYRTRDYKLSTGWPEISSLEELAKTEYFKELFSKPFTTYIIEAFEIVRPGSAEETNFFDGMSAEETEAVKQQFYELARHLIHTYKDTGKTFVLQNWEGDNAMKNKGPNPVETAAIGMADWLNARQDGIIKAREELKDIKGVRVLGAAEVSKLPFGSGMAADPDSVVERVIPATHMDLYSYSDWETGAYANTLKYALDYLAKKAPDDTNFGFGDKNIYLGEYGAAENLVKGEQNQLAQIKVQNEAALDWGVQYTLNWELYCNEPYMADFSGTPTNDDLKGYWLIRPDGTKTASWEYFRDLFEQDRKNITDKLGNWHRMYAHSSNLVRDELRNGVDYSFRVRSGDGKKGELIYKISYPSGVRISAFYKGNPEKDLAVYMSKDFKRWDRIDLKASSTEVSGEGWMKTTLRPVSKIPAGAGFIRIVIPESGNTELSGIEIGDIKAQAAEGTGN